MLNNFSVRRPLAICAFFAVVVLTGYISLQRLPVSLMPELTLPQLSVITKYEGASPKDVESLVTRPLEESVGTISGVEKVLSTSRRGHSSIKVFFQPGTTMDFAAADIREKIELVQGELPEGAETPIVLKHNPDDFPILSVVMHGESKIYELRNYAEIVKRELSRVRGVAEVKNYGLPKKVITVEANKERLRAHGISILDINQSLSSSNLSFKLGEMYQGGRKFLIRGVGEFSGPGDINNVAVGFRNNSIIQLSQVARTRSAQLVDEIITRYQGNRSVVFQVMKKRGANLIGVTERIRRTISQTKNVYLPQSINLTLLNKKAEFIRRALSSVQVAVFLGSLLAFLTILLFLGDIRHSLIISTAIPVSIFATFVLLYLFGYSLNLMTLGGLALGAGMLVDNSIVVLESISRHYNNYEGKGYYEPIKSGVREVSGAIVASTLTTVFVFLPIAFMQNFVAKMFRILAIVISTSLVVSLLVALFLIPALVSLFYQIEEQLGWVFEKPGAGRKLPDTLGAKFYDLLSRSIYPVYFLIQKLVDRASNWINAQVEIFSSYVEITLNAFWNRRKLFVITSFSILIALGYIFFTGLETGLFPSLDSSNFILNLQFKRGTTLHQTDSNYSTIKEILSRKDILQHALFFTGYEKIEGNIRSNVIRIQGTLVPSLQRERTVQEFLEDVSTQLESLLPVDVTHELAFGGFAGNLARLPEPIEVQIKGFELNLLDKLSTRIKHSLNQKEALSNVKRNFRRNRPEFRVNIQRERLSRYGLTVRTVAKTAETALSGRVPTTLNRGDESIDIKVKMQNRGNLTLGDLNQVPLVTVGRSTLNLGRVATVSRVPTVPFINHVNNLRTATVTANIISPNTGSVYWNVKKVLEKMSMPQGFHLEVTGAFTVYKQLNREILFVALLSILLVYMTMAGQFNAFIPPFIVIFSVPMAFVGSISVLSMAGWKLSAVSSMGFIVLTGIVVNNAILIVDLILQYLKDMTFKEACIKASRIRVRPVLMTTLTTSLGLFPLLLSRGEASSLQKPLALVVMSGLVGGTLLILVLIPLVFGTILSDNYEVFR